MRKLILTVALLVTIIGSTFAQFTIGPKVGLNLAKVYAGKEGLDEDIDFKTGLNVGIFGRYEINERFAIQPEVLYSQQGYKSHINLFDHLGYPIGEYGYKASSHYVNIPILVKYYPLKRFYVEAGPQVGFCVSSDFSADDNELESIIKKLDTDYNTVDFSLTGGVGFHLGYGLSVNVRYNHGFTKTLNESLWKNRVISFSFSYDLWSL